MWLNLTSDFNDLWIIWLAQKKKNHVYDFIFRASPHEISFIYLFIFCCTSQVPVSSRVLAFTILQDSYCKPLWTCHWSSRSLKPSSIWLTSSFPFGKLILDHLNHSSFTKFYLIQSLELVLSSAPFQFHSLERRFVEAQNSASFFLKFVLHYWYHSQLCSYSKTYKDFKLISDVCIFISMWIRLQDKTKQ